MSLARCVLALSMIGLAASAAGCKPNRGDETVACNPGAHIWIGCNQACALGSCSGDPWMRICDGDTAVGQCDDDALIAENDDATELCYSTCPMVQMICPDSGRITVTLRAYTGRTSAFSCDWRVEERAPRHTSGPEPDAGSEPEVDAGSEGESDAGDAS